MYKEIRVVQEDSKFFLLRGEGVTEKELQQVKGCLVRQGDLEQVKADVHQIMIATIGKAGDTLQVV